MQIVSVQLLAALLQCSICSWPCARQGNVWFKEMLTGVMCAPMHASSHLPPFELDHCTALICNDVGTSPKNSLMVSYFFKKKLKWKSIWLNQKVSCQTNLLISSWQVSVFLILFNRNSFNQYIPESNKQSYTVT